MNSIYFNRELSWIKFNKRVLEEAEDYEHPLLERLKFLSIFTSNLDEFFMIRVAGINEQISANIFEKSPDGLTPLEQLTEIQKAVQPLLDQQANILLNEIIVELKRSNVFFKKHSELSENQKKYLTEYFSQNLFPILTPIAIDSSHPIPQLRGLVINLLVEIRDPANPKLTKIAFVPIPSILPRFIHFHNEKSYEIILIEDLISAHIGQLFSNLEIVDISLFRLTRNADLVIAEEEADDLLKLIERELRKRRLGSIVRLEVLKSMSQEKVDYLKKVFELDETDIYYIDKYFAVSQFAQLISIIDKPELKDQPFVPALNPQVLNSRNIFDAIKQKDILFIHPYDSFNPVVELIRAAAVDPDVIAIKQTLYRTSGKSPIIQALKEAAGLGKEVTTLIELKARFDEENNIIWAKELEQAGVNVVYGMIGLKIHSKVLLILRKEKNQIKNYLHLSSGNYNEKTATLYTDIGLMTTDPDIGADVAELFNVLTGFSLQQRWRCILVAPYTLRMECVQLINKCIEACQKGEHAHIKIIMNSLTDPEMIDSLYQASSAGVKIDLIIRGICCLVPGIKGLSEKITVRSIVGRFLEHSRVLCFEFGDQVTLYSGSADWMQRNLNRRIEVMFPIKDKETKEKLLDFLNIMLSDRKKAKFLQPDGAYVKLNGAQENGELSAQEYFLQQVRLKQLYTDTTLSSS